MTILADLRVLDFSRMLAGPYCAMLLADFGADVIRVEPPEGAMDRRVGPFGKDGTSLVPLCVNRNKRGITLNLRSPAGERLLDRLVSCADVVVHNFTPGSPESELLAYDRLKGIEPRIIVAGISAFGSEGPSAGRSAFDNILQAESGSMSFTGFPGNPPTRSAVAYVDVLAGTNAAFGILLALRERERSGRGQFVDSALMDAAVSIPAAYGVFAEFSATGEIRRPIGNHSFWAYSDVFKARDGAWVTIVVMGTSMWHSFLAACGLRELKDDARFAADTDRRSNRYLLSDLIAPWFASHPSQEILTVLEKAHVPCGRINDVAEVTRHPQVAYRKMLPELDYGAAGRILVNGVSIKLSQTPSETLSNAPLPGHHNGDVYRKLLGLSDEELQTLRNASII